MFTKHMKHWLATVAVLLCSLAANAHDFEVGGIYYNITSSTDLTVAVTYRGNNSSSYSNEYSGTVTIPETVTYNNNTYSVTSIESSAFHSCSSLTSITLPEGVTYIGNSAFGYCRSLTSITIPEGVRSIGVSVFYECSSLTSITLPEGVTYIGNSAFHSCSSLTSITIPEGVTSIGMFAFCNCSSLTSITIPEGVASIRDYAFRVCNSLTSINIPEGVTSIGDGAFSGCSSLTSITIPESVTSIGDGAFYYCGSLTSITLPASVTSIGEDAFGDCSSLTSIIVAEDNKKYDSRGGCNAIIETNSNTLIQGCSTTIIPASVTSIGYAAFFGCSGLTSITLPASVTSIGEYAFSDCSSLTSIIVAEDNKKYDSRGGCNAIIETSSNTLIQGCSTTIIPASVTSIGDGAFGYCRSLTSITIPEGVTSIGDDAFYSCDNLTSITLSEGLTSIENGAFYGCESLTSITIPEGVTSIGDDVFYSCDNLTSITIPEGVTSIGDGAFEDCSSLTSITIPEGVTSIGYSAFYNCSSLTSITCKAATPPTIGGSSTFYAVNKTIPVYVPEGSVTSYRTAAYWNEFSNIQPSSRYYLKNVGSGKFLTAANSWGTQASLGEHGLDVAFIKLTNGKYTIETQVKNSDTDHYLGSNLYMDAPEAEWIITALSNGNYTLSLDGTHYIGCDGTSVVANTSTDPTDANVQWQFLTKEDLIAEMENATFFIDGANFSRNDQRNATWIGAPVLGGDDANLCAEKWNVEAFDVHQQLSGLPNGLYELRAQGYYRVGGTENENTSELAASQHSNGTESLNAILYANAQEIPLMSIMEGAQQEDIYAGNGNFANTSLGYIPFLMTGASNMFSKGLYQNSLFVEVTDGTLRVGVKKTQGEMFDWVCFDNFKLYYYGSAITISDTQASFSQANNKRCLSITYTRNFKNTNWQALYVPFEIPVTEEFLDDFEIAYINDVHQFDDDNDGTIDRTEVEAIKKVSGTLEANYPYLIRAKVAGEKQIVVTDAMLYAAEENSIDCSSVFNSYTFTGTYKKIPAVQLPKEEGYYAMSGGDWKQYSSGATSSLGAFRIYMKIDSRNENMKAQAHTIKMRVVGCDDEADDVTGIDDSQLTMDNSPLVIYDMQGRRITDMANLKGVYIVNGKKVVY